MKMGSLTGVSILFESSLDAAEYVISAVIGIVSAKRPQLEASVTTNATASSSSSLGKYLPHPMLSGLQLLFQVIGAQSEQVGFSERLAA